MFLLLLASLVQAHPGRELVQNLAGDQCQDFLASADEVLTAAAPADDRERAAYLSLRAEREMCAGDFDAYLLHVEEGLALLEGQAPSTVSVQLLDQWTWAAGYQGDYDTVVPRRQEQLRHLEAVVPEQDPERQLVEVRVGIDALRKGDFEGAKARFARLEALLSPEPATADELEVRLMVAKAVFNTGDRRGMQRLLEPLHGCCRQVLEERPKLALDVYNALGTASEDPNLGVRWYEQGRALYEDGLVPPTYNLYLLLTNLAYTWLEAGHPDRGLGVLETGDLLLDELEVQEMVSPALLVESRARLHLIRGNLYWKLEEREATERELLACLALLPEAPDDLELAILRSSAQHRLAELYGGLGRTDEALSLAHSAHALSVRVQGPDNPSVAERLQLIGHLEAERGNYAEAFLRFSEAEELLLQVYGGPNESVATLWNNEAIARDEIGDGVGAALALERALEVWNERAPSHPTAAAVRTNLASVLINLGRLDEAEALLDKAQAMAGQPSLRRALVSLRSTLASKRGQYHRALELREQTLALHDSAEGYVDPTTVRTQLLGLAGLRLELGQLEQARALLEELTSRYGEERGLEWLRLQVAWARLLEDEGAHDRAVATARSAALESRRLGARLLPGLSERGRQGMLEELRLPLRAWLSLTHGEPADPELFEVAAASFAADRRLLERHRQLERVGADETSRALVRRLVTVRRSLAEASLDVERAGELVSLERERDDLEAELSRLSSSPGPDATVAQLCARLGPDEVLLEYVDYAARPGLEVQQTGSVWVMRGGEGCGLERVPLDLAPSSSIRRALTMGEGLPGSERALRHARALYDWMWAPVLPALQGRSRVWVVPGDALSTVAIAALTDPSGRQVVEDYTLALLPDSASLTGRPHSQAEGASPLLVGDVSFGMGSRQGPCKEPLRFEPLPGTQEELRRLERLYRRQHPEVLEGEAVTESLLEEVAPSHQVLHLATHGYFTLPGCEGRVGNVLPAKVSSGVVLAGVNRPPRADGDGLWTAAEVASLSLEQVQLVLLSACSAGRGSVTGGGVIGLQRAFTVAGVQSLVAALWAVEDEATSELMVQLHKERTRGAAPADALRQAQLRLLDAARRNYHEPMLHQWAAFQASGPAALGPLP